MPEEVTVLQYQSSYLMVLLLLLLLLMSNLLFVGNPYLLISLLRLMMKIFC